MNTDTLLAQRGQTHGDFSELSDFAQDVKTLMRSAQWGKLDAAQKEALDLIVTKIGRIVAGSPGHRDHWDDIAGYAKLGANQCPDLFRGGGGGGGTGGCSGGTATGPLGPNT